MQACKFGEQDCQIDSVELPLLYQGLQALGGRNIRNCTEPPLDIVATCFRQCLPCLEDQIGVHLSEFVPGNVGKFASLIEKGFQQMVRYLTQELPWCIVSSHLGPPVTARFR